MDAALASLRSAMESLLEEKLQAALTEVAALRAETARLKAEQQALAKESGKLREETESLRGELKELRLGRLSDPEAASTAPPGSPARRAESPGSPASASSPGADGKAAVERVPLSLRKAWYLAALERVLVLELADETQVTENNKPIKLEEQEEGLEANAGNETEDLWANWKPGSRRDGRDRARWEWEEELVKKAVQIKATSVVHLRAEPAKDARKNGSKLQEGELAWSDAQVNVEGVMFYRVQSGWAPLLRQKGQNILEEVAWDSDWSRQTWDWKGEAGHGCYGYGGYGPQKQSGWKDGDRYGGAGRAGRAWGNWRGG
ncbi:unnamed protein product [Symbiodinium sp. CCMP2592]|nr:unnamed protein product [Symbiodinium sp. CCMP2592]